MLGELTMFAGCGVSVMRRNVDFTRLMEEVYCSSSRFDAEPSHHPRGFQMPTLWLTSRAMGYAASVPYACSPSTVSRAHTKSSRCGNWSMVATQHLYPCRLYCQTRVFVGPRGQGLRNVSTVCQTCINSSADVSLSRYTGV